MAEKLLFVVLGAILVVYATEVDESEPVEITCTHQGKTYDLGESIGDPCHPCVCELTGEMICLNITCWVVQCADAHKEQSHCCFLCPNGNNCKHENGVIPQGETLDLVDEVCSCPSQWFSMKLGWGEEVYTAECTRKDGEIKVDDDGK